MDRIDCFREPIPEIFTVAEMLSKAADAHLAGEAVQARSLLRACNTDALRAWTESIWGKDAISTRRFRSLEDVHPYLKKEQRLTVRMPNTAERKSVVLRDGYHCRFCGTPVADAKVRTLFSKLYPDEVPWGSTNLSQHAAFQILWLQYDHVVPHCRGGDNSLDNIIVTCGPCNYGRGQWLLEEVGLNDPRLRAPKQSSWDGLARVLT